MSTAVTVTRHMLTARIRTWVYIATLLTPMSERLEDLLAKQEVMRTMQHQDPAIQRALTMLNQPMNPVHTVTKDDYARLGIPARAERAVGFRVQQPGQPMDDRLFVNKHSDEYDIAQDPRNALASMMLAGVLAHEQTHTTEKDEYAPMRLEADFIRSKLPTLSGKQREVGEMYLQEVERMAQAADPKRWTKK